MTMTDLTTSTHQLSRLLMDWGNGDAAALAELAPIVDGELRRLARYYLHKQKRGQFLQTTALVNEAWLRLIDWENSDWRNRAHFFGMAARLMRQILIEETRKRQSQKRFGLNVSLSEANGIAWEKRPDLVALDDALNALAELDIRKSRVVELRFFGGLSIEETAEVVNLSPATVKREWSTAKLWLRSQISKA